MSGPTPEHRAFVEGGLGILMAVIMADGKYSQAEFVWFKTLQNRHGLFADVPADPFNAMLDRVKQRLKVESWQALVNEWAGAVPERFRVSVFDLAAELAVIDKELGGRESEVIKHLGRALRIPDAQAQSIFASKVSGLLG
jgi:uncharacterized tellurite resistance protein B-like protein